MDILFKTIRDANTFEQNEIHKIYNQSFPKIEKMSFDYILSMTTNTLDKKRNSNGTYSLFSFIQKLDPDLQTSRSAKEKKTLEYNYGFVKYMTKI